jgi:ABC-type glycerol-3-phosphate transport system substrate-binding protein
MNKFFLKTLLYAMVFLVLISLVSCGKKEIASLDKSQSTSFNDNTGNGNDIAIKNKVNVRYILLGKLKGKVKENFEKLNPNINIVYDIVEYADLEQKLLIAHGTNDDYDIIQTNHSSVPQFVFAGILEPLDGYIKAAGIDFSTYQQEAVKIGQMKGIQYAIPYEPDCRIFAYNKKILKEAGVKPPNTMQEVLNVAKAVNKKGYYAMAGSYSKLWFPIYDIGCWMLGNGGHVYVLDGEKYKATLNTPEVLEYVKWSKEIFQYMPKDPNMDDFAVRDMFIKGKIAMYWWGPWEVNLIEPYMDMKNVGFSIMPKGKVKSGSSMGGWMYGIGAGAKNKEEAWKFVEYMLKPENMAVVTGALPADRRALKYPPFNSKKYEIFNEQLKTAEYPAPPTPVYPQIAEVFNKYFNQAMVGKITPEQACEYSNTEAQKYLDALNKQ